MENKQIITFVIIIALIFILLNTNLSTKKSTTSSIIDVHYYNENDEEIYPFFNPPIKTGNFDFSSITDFFSNIFDSIKSMIRKIPGLGTFATVPIAGQCVPPPGGGTSYCPSGFFPYPAFDSCEDVLNKCFFGCVNSVGSSTTVTCSYACDKKSECGTDGYTGSKMCGGSNTGVYQNYRTYSCVTYKCFSSNVMTKIESCAYGCTSGVCNPAPPPPCTPKTCSSLGFNCDSASDTCGGTLNCGTCSGDYMCVSNLCQRVYIRFNITASNTGNVKYSNVYILDATPVEFKNALTLTDIRTLDIGQSTTWNSNKIDVKSEWKPSKTFDVSIIGTNDYTQILETKSGTLTVLF